MIVRSSMLFAAEPQLFPSDTRALPRREIKSTFLIIRISYVAQ